MRSPRPQALPDDRLHIWMPEVRAGPTRDPMSERPRHDRMHQGREPISLPLPGCTSRRSSNKTEAAGRRAAMTTILIRESRMRTAPQQRGSSGFHTRTGRASRSPKPWRITSSGGTASLTRKRPDHRTLALREVADVQNVPRQAASGRARHLERVR